MEQRTKIGYLVGGGLKENFQVRLTVSSQDIQEGAFVVIQSGAWHYYGIVTDIQLGATDPRFADEQMDGRFPPQISKALHGQTLYANLEVLPNLMLEVGPEPGTPEQREWQGKIDAGLKDKPRVLPVKNIPPHHAQVFLANEGDIEEIFGKDEKAFFEIGRTREGDSPVRIDLKKFVQRSSGIFGATGSGKSFLTRVTLAGLILKTDVSLLVFDMHNEYGYTYNPPEGGAPVPGLKDKLGSKVRIVGLGRGQDAMYQGLAPDINLEIAMSDIHTGDIEILARELNLRETTATTLAALANHFGVNWFREFMKLENLPKQKDEDGKAFYPEGSLEGWAESAGIHLEAAKGLHSRLSKRVAALPYLVEKPANDGVGQIVNALQSGQSVILSFGRYDKDLDYLLVSNILTRRIREVWEEKTNQYHRTKDALSLPRPLVIVIEEAHKLLNREMASQTTFSTIARELRKYYVTLLIIDQRPSQIYDEVISQLGTRISGWLGDDNDIQSVLSGLSGRDALKGMLARLQAGQEVLLLGPWGVPMPISVRSRRYDETFWKELLGNKTKKSEAQILKELGV
ncbi:MAG: ATP-binding protein [Anaerolineales bacterium]|nr:ATP-binding protein [Anaerolineales bacterium]